MTTIQIPEQLKKLAKDLREEAMKVEKRRIVKCAQVLVAAKGLSRLDSILYGGDK